MIRRLVTSSVVAAITGALALLAGESLLRWREGTRDTVPGTAPTAYYRHARLGHALVRNHSYFSWFHVGPQGFRGSRVVPASPPAGRTRIMVVGGSTTFDSYVTSDERAWPARLEHWLNDLAGSEAFEVLNAGTPGYLVLDNLIRMQTELYQYKPDLVVLYHTHNDLLAALGRAAAASQPQTDTPGEIRPQGRTARWLARHSVLYGKVLLRYKAIASRYRAIARAGEAAPAGIGAGASRIPSETGLSGIDASLFAHDLRGFVAVCRALGLPLVFVQVARQDSVSSASRLAWATAIPGITVRQVMATYAMFDSTLARVGHEAGVPVLSTAAFGLSDADHYADQDAIHFNDLGAERMARQMARSLSATLREVRPVAER